MSFRSMLLVGVVYLLAAACSAEPATTPTTATEPPVTTTTSTVAAAASPASTTTTIAPVDQQPVEQQPVEQVRDRLVIHAVGDVSFAPNENAAFRVHGFDIAFSGLDGIFQRDDLTIINLECDPSAIGSPMSDKPWSFRCDLESLPEMVRAGIDVAGMGNNHSADFGFESMIDARANLEAAGLNPIGAGADLAEANQPRIFAIGGWTIGVVAFSAVSGYSFARWFASVDGPGVAPATVANMTEVVTALDPIVDIVIVSIHQEPYNHTDKPFPIEVERVHALIDAGADAIVAHHHHRLLPYEYFEGVPIFWGMGNFVWSKLNPTSDTSGVAEIVVEPDGTITGRLIPAYIESSGHPVLRGQPDFAVRSDREGLD